MNELSTGTLLLILLVLIVLSVAMLVAGAVFLARRSTGQSATVATEAA